ncbi:MAG: alpha-1,2-fucosyltransferase [Spirochaetales bacterium]|nr:alpha-1,2-fucosyltransferase [Spirochaetales bacterium]
MKIVKIIGGIGNQMFQYAFGEFLKKYDDEIFFDINFFDNYKLHKGFEIEEAFSLKLKTVDYGDVKKYTSARKNFILNKLYKLLKNKNECVEYVSDLKDDDFHKKIYFNGYWQRFSYVGESRDRLIEAFKFNVDDEKVSEYSKKMSGVNSISVHVRRGDYIGHKYLGDICNLDYYREAISICNNRLENCVYFIFSDDIEWCRSNFLGDNYVFVDALEKDYYDIFLMTQCQHNIIANSSFSWWGAFLNLNGGLVLCPKKWSKYKNSSDLIDPNWIVVEGSYDN